MTGQSNRLDLIVARCSGSHFTAMPAWRERYRMGLSLDGSPALSSADDIEMAPRPRNPADPLPDPPWPVPDLPPGVPNRAARSNYLREGLDEPRTK